MLLKMSQHVENMSKEGQMLFDSWNEELASMRDADIRERSGKRQEEVRKPMAAGQGRYQEPQKNTRSFYGECQKILSGP